MGLLQPKVGRHGSDGRSSAEQERLHRCIESLKCSVLILKQTYLVTATPAANQSERQPSACLKDCGIGRQINARPCAKFNYTNTDLILELALQFRRNSFPRSEFCMPMQAE